ncbi:hypothetical protein HEP87_33280 [Streptomyces sp. S1D4-11]|nr:transposase [Streptomyces sp. S1D4-11]QIY97960.1 hypothetical protein HEP87_33280 [Streptomyces sp. S1D4-11]
MIHSVLHRVECPRLSNGPLREQDNSPRTGQARGALERLTARYEKITAGRTLHPPRAPANRAARDRVANLLTCLDTERDQALPFAFDRRVPFDNNSEQVIRMARIQRKAARQHPVKRSCLVVQLDHAVVEPGRVEDSKRPPAER